MKKRILSFLLALMTVLSVPCVRADAAGEDSHNIYLHYSDTQVVTQTIAHGEKLDWPGEAEQEGQTFLGWFLSDGEPYDFDLPVTEDIHLYARFGHKVAYYVGDFRTMTQYVDHGQPARVPPEPEMEGLHFMGWYTEYGELYDFTLPVTGSFSLYAWFAENPFSDVPEDSFYAEPVLWALEYGITNGATETTFDPNGTCLRAQVITFLYRADDCPDPGTGSNPFTDVKPGDFFYSSVLWALEHGITNGTTETTFGAYDSCSRAAVVTFLWRAVGSPEPESTENPFVDVQPGDYFYKAVLWAVELGLTNGVDDTHFAPADPCSRAQVVTFFYRICH